MSRIITLPLTFVLCVIAFGAVGMALQHIAEWIDGPPQTNICIYVRDAIVCGEPVS